MATVPGQMFTNQLNPAKGWPSPSALDCRAKISPLVLYSMVAGQAAHIDNSGLIQPGVVNNTMGVFIFQGANEYDTNNTPSPGQWYPINPSGNILCLVAKAPYELESTEFDATQTYTPNQPLRAPSGNTATAYGGQTAGPNSGQLTNQSVVLYSQTNTPQSSATAVCGIVSNRGVFKNSYGQAVVAFWPVWAPGRSTET